MSNTEKEIDQALKIPTCRFIGMPNDEFIKRLESSFPLEQIRYKKIVKLIPAGDEWVIKWETRQFVLTDGEINNIYSKYFNR